MTDQIREQMSALLDGELPPGETSLLVRRMARDAELKRAFGSYVLAGETLRAPGGLVASRGFAARVAAAIESAEIVAAPLQADAVQQTAGRRWWRPAAATAVAASAALAAVLLVRPDADSGRQFAERSGAPARAPLVSMPVVGGASLTPAQSQRLAGYLVVHGQYASPIGRRNVWSNALATDPGVARVNVQNPEAR
jgi:negative regulator of sigma E activity